MPHGSEGFPLMLDFFFFKKHLFIWLYQVLVGHAGSSLLRGGFFVVVHRLSNHGTKAQYLLCAGLVALRYVGFLVP